MHSYNAEILIPDLPIHPPSHIWIPQNDGLSLDQTSGRPLKGCFTTNLAKKSKSNRSDPTVVGQSPQFDQFPARWGSLGLLELLPPSLLPSFLLPSFRRTLTASARSQWALPDVNAMRRAPDLRTQWALATGENARMHCQIGCDKTPL